MSRKSPKEYIAIFHDPIPLGMGIEYAWDGQRFLDRAGAVDHGMQERVMRDFSIGELYCGALLAFYWMGEEKDRKDHNLAEIASHIGLKACCI